MPASRAADRSGEMGLDVFAATEIVQRLDAIGGVFDVAVGEWRVWPAVKRLLHERLLRDATPANPGTGGAVYPRNRQLAAAAIAAWQLARERGWRRHPQTIALTRSLDYRQERPDGTIENAYLGPLFDLDEPPLPFFVIENPNRIGHLPNVSGPRHLYEDALHLSASALARHPRIRRRTRDAAVTLSPLLVSGGYPLHRDRLTELLHRELAAFEARRIVYRRLFEHRSARALLVIDADGVPAQIAAAKECGATVLELQHGAMPAVHIGYSWPKEMRSLKPCLPVPDRILVYGRHDRETLLQGGFWAEEEVVAVGSPRIDRCRRESQGSRARPAGTLRLIFTTQWTTREAAIQFWRGFLAAAERLGFPVELQVKVHPVEEEALPVYRQSLERDFPALCRVVPPNPVSTHDAIAASDVHLSFYSSCLMESIALGVPTISIRGGPVPGGYIAWMRVPALTEAMREVASPGELVELLASLGPGSEALRRWTEETRRQGMEFFAEGFADQVVEVLREVKGSRADLSRT